MSALQQFRGGITRLWWVPLITGLLAIGLGIWSLFSPVTSIEVFAYIFAACIVGAGILNLAYSITTNGFDSNWGWAMALGLIEIIAGIWMLTLPAQLLATAFVIVVGVWILVSAIMSIAEAGVMSAYSPGWIVWMILLLVATVIFAIIFLSSPIAGGVAVWMFLGISLLLFGIYRISLAFQIRALNRRLRHTL